MPIIVKISARHCKILLCGHYEWSANYKNAENYNAELTDECFSFYSGHVLQWNVKDHFK